MLVEEIRAPGYTPPVYGSVAVGAYTPSLHPFTPTLTSPSSDIETILFRGGYNCNSWAATSKDKKYAFVRSLSGDEREFIRGHVVQSLGSLSFAASDADVIAAIDAHCQNVRETVIGHPFRVPVGSHPPGAVGDDLSSNTALTFIAGLVLGAIATKVLT